LALEETDQGYLENLEMVNMRIIDENPGYARAIHMAMSLYEGDVESDALFAGAVLYLAMEDEIRNRT